MKLFTLFFLYYCIFNNISCISEGVYFPKKDNVIILTDYTFKEAFREYPYLFISVYSEVCFSCIHHINPTLSNLSKEIENNEPELKDIVAIAKIDGSYNNYFMRNYNILGYPTLILIKNGIIQSELIYRKKVDDIILFLRKHILKPIQYIKNINQYNRLLKNSDKESIITYYGQNKQDINSLIEISYKYNHLTFINIQEQKLIKNLNATEGQLSINKFFDEPKIIESPTNNELWTNDTIDKFIQKYNHRLLIDFGKKEGENLLNLRKNLLLLINKQELTNEQLKRVKYMDKINIKEIIMTDENKINNKNFLEIAKNVRDIIQSSFILYSKNLINLNENEEKKERKKSILDEEDPFGFEKLRQEKKDCEKRQIQFINNKLDLDIKKNCEIRLLDMKNEKNPKFYKLNCGKEYIKDNIIFIRNWFNNIFVNDDFGINFDLSN